MTLAELHYAFKLNMDRVDKASSTDFNTAEIDWLLNEAQLTFIKRRLNSSPSYEANQKTTDELSSIHIKYPLQPIIQPIKVEDGIYEIPLNLLTYPYFRLLRLTATANNKGCTNNAILKFMQTDDLSEVLVDPFNSPNSEFIPYNFGRSSSNDGSSIYAYSSGINLSNVKIEYIKTPARVNFGNYAYIDGSLLPQQGLETPESTHQEIVDIACQIAGLNIENPEYIQLRDRKIIINE
jgi:hypothetical protein